MRLTNVRMAVLEFETQQRTYPGAKEQAIRETFNWSATRYPRC